MRKLIIIVFIVCLICLLNTHIDKFRQTTTDIDDVSVLVSAMSSKIKNDQPVHFISNNISNELFFQVQFIMAPNILRRDKEWFNDSMVLFIKDKRVVTEQIVISNSMFSSWQTIWAGSNNSFDITLFKKQ